VAFSSPNNFLTQICFKVVELLDQRDIQVSSVDFVRFTWLNKLAYHWQGMEEDDNDDNSNNDEDSVGDDNSNEDDSIDSKDDNNDTDTDNEEDNKDDEEQNNNNEENNEDVKDSNKGADEDIKPFALPAIDRLPFQNGERYYTNPTIWIGVLPNTLTGAVAHKSSEDIRTFLDLLHIENIDIAYRESISMNLSSHGPALLGPIEDSDPLEDITNNVSVPLSLPIVGHEPSTQGTLGPYFHVGDKLYAIALRHNIFLPNDANKSYRYQSMF
jgi:hypothetical protein